MKTKIAILCALAFVACSCGSGNNNSGGTTGQAGLMSSVPAESPLRSFPDMTVPSVYGDNTEEAREYVLDHYWDAFLNGEGRTDSGAILGVADAEVEQALANYIQILSTLKLESTPDDMTSLKQAQGSVKKFFKKLESRQLADTSSRAYMRITELVAKYLYDPNSPMRDEDFYLPFVESMAVSPCTRENMRNAFRFEASQCRKNGFGQTVPNFNFKDKNGNRGSLHAINADYTMLFFSNPGCTSCKEIIDDINACSCIRPMISDHRLAIVNIYIDEEVQKWREYLPNYPKEWINGYDYTFSLRENGGYDIRAIPSLYLLDARKRVIMKDAPTGNVLTYLENLYNQ